jgi:hypothetical protein
MGRNGNKGRIVFLQHKVYINKLPCVIKGDKMTYQAINYGFLSDSTLEQMQEKLDKLRIGSEWHMRDRESIGDYISGCLDVDTETFVTIWCDSREYRLRLQSDKASVETFRDYERDTQRILGALAGADYWDMEKEEGQIVKGRNSRRRIRKLLDSVQ